MRTAGGLVIALLLASCSTAPRPDGPAPEELRADVLAQHAGRIEQEARQAVVEDGGIPVDVELGTLVLIYRDGDAFDSRLRVRAAEGCRVLAVNAMHDADGGLRWNAAVVEPSPCT